MERQAIIKGSALLTLSGYLSGFLWYIFFLVAARRLGVEDFGRLMFALTFVALFRFTMDIGLSQLSQREIARDTELVDEYFSNVMWLKFLLFLLSVCLIAVLINLLNYPPVVRKSVYILSVAEGLNSFSDFFRSIFRAYHKVHFETVIWVAERVAVLSLGIVVLYMGGGLIGVALTILVTALLKFLSGFIVLSKRFLQGFKCPSLVFMKYNVKKGFVIGLAATFGYLYFKIDTVMLSVMVGDKSVGLYNASYTILDGMIVLSTSIGGVLYTSLSSTYKKDEIRFRSISQASIKYMLMFSIPMASFVTITAKEIMALIYGTNYLEGTRSLQVLIWTLTFHSILVVLSTCLFAIGEEKKLIFALILTVIENVLLNLLLIPAFHEVGAAIATLISDVSVTALYFQLLSSAKMKIHLPDSITPTIFATLALSVVNIFAMKWIPLLIVIPLMAILYLTIYIALGLLSINDIRMLVGLSAETTGTDLVKMRGAK